jgi:hypothetical protein
MRVREICDKHGVLFVSDSVICAFGRLGKWFGIERFGGVPDMISFAKGLTSGYLPMGGVVVNDKISSTLREKAPMFAHGSTFGGHPVSSAVALENIAVMEREKLVDGRRLGVRRHSIHARRPQRLHPRIRPWRPLRPVDPRPTTPASSRRWRLRTPGPGKNSAGLAVFRYETKCGTVWGHTGYTPGYTQLMAATPDGSRSVVVSINERLTPEDGAPGVLPALRAAERRAVCAALAP